MAKITFPGIGNFRLSSASLRIFGLSTLTASLIVPGSFPTLPTQAASINGVTTTFSQVPQLVRAHTSNIATGVTNATYEFTLTVPANAGRSLQAIAISPEGPANTVTFDVNKSYALADNGTAVPLASIGGSRSENGRDITIAFDQPIAPGTTVTITLQADHNPASGGVYLFGITAYPTGEKSVGQFLGYARLNFYSNSN